MSDVLVRIKRAVLAGRYAFSEKARMEMESDRLTELDVAESILNAVAIYKKIRSTNPRRKRLREYLYIIESVNLDGLAIYSKGKLVRETGQDVYYFLVSSKRALVRVINRRLVGRPQDLADVEALELARKKKS